MTPVFRKKRYIVLVLVPVLLALVALSPFLLSTPSALHFFVSAVNKRIAGRLSIESWLVGWQQGILCQNVAYSNTEKGISITVPTLTTSRGLLELLLAPKNLGRVNVDSPQIELAGRAVRAFFAGDETTAAEKSYAEQPEPFWESISVDLQSREGSLRVNLDDQDMGLAFRGMSVDAALAGGIAELAVKLRTVDQGFIEASGSVNLPAHRRGWLETVVADLKFTVNSLQVRDFMQAGAKLHGLSGGEGILNGDFQFKVAGIEDVAVNGLAELTGVTLEGGLLGEDRPVFRKIHLAIAEGRWTPRGWSVRDLAVDSDTLDLKGSAEAAPEILRINARGRINLPVLFDQFPNLVRVHEETFLETGLLEFTVDLAREKPDMQVRLKTKAGNIGGVHRDQLFFWDEPVSLYLNGEKTGAEVNVGALQFDSPFARIKGRGDLHTFAMDAAVDMERTFSDIATLFQSELTGSGALEMTVKNSRAETEAGRFAVDTDLTVSDFSLRKGGGTVIPLHEFSLIGGFRAPDTFFEEPAGELDLQVVVSSWLGEVFLALNGDRKEDRPFRGFFTTDMELSLAELSPILHAVDLFHGDQRMGGTLQLQSAGFAGGSILEIRDLAAEITGFTLEGNRAVLHDPLVRLHVVQPANDEVSFLTVRELQVAADKQDFFRDGAGLNLFDYGEGKIFLNRVQAEAETATAAINKLVIGDLQKPSASFRGQVSLTADLEKVTQGLRSFGVLPGDMMVSGSSELSFFLDELDGAGREMKVSGTIGDFGIRQKNTELLADDQVAFSSHFKGEIPTGDMSVNELRLQSKTLNFEAGGTVSVHDGQQLLELNGTMQPFLDRVGIALGKWGGLDLAMTGHPQEKFTVRYPLWKNPQEKPPGLGIFSSLHADTVNIESIELTEVSLPFHLEGNRLHMELSALLNGGRLELVTDTDIAAEPAVMKTPGNSQIMTGVRLSDPLAEIVFSRIHPFFGVLGQTGGPIDVRLDSLWWPIGEAGRKEGNFVAIFDIRDLEIAGSEVLRDILILFGLEKEKLELRDNELYCIGKNGRIKCSPVRLLAGESEIVVGGTTSLDATLDYEVQVPITGKIVSAEGYDILGGTMIRVPVKGTVAEPQFDRKATLATLRGLMEQAADELVEGEGEQKEAAGNED